MPDNKLKDNEIIKDISFEKKTAYYKKEIKDFFSRYENKSGGEDCTEVCLIRAGYRTVLKAEEEINRLQAELKVSNEALNNSIKLNNRLETQNKDLAETVHNLTLEKDALFDKSEELKAEVERLNTLVKTKNKLIKGLYQSINYAYDREIKEFAERLKNEIINDTAYACDSTQHSGYYDYQIKIGDIPEYIDNLVKEIVGEDK